MKNKEFHNIFNDNYYENTEGELTFKEKFMPIKENMWFKIAIIVLLVSVVGGIICYINRPIIYTINPVFYQANITIGDVEASYTGRHIIEDFSEDMLGNVFQKTDYTTWFYPADRTNAGVLIGVEKDGTAARWSFYKLSVPSETYSYREVLTLIYNLDSAVDIVSIKTEPAAGKYDYGLKYKMAVGKHTYKSKEDIEAIYNIFAGLKCFSSEDMNLGDQERFNYSFSAKEEKQELSREDVLASRDITITLADGTSISGWTYNALSGCIYQKYYVYAEPLSDDDVYKLNEIFGIK